MENKSKIMKIGEDLCNRFQSLEGTIVREGLQPFKLRLGKDEQGAMVNDVVDKYMKKELTNEYLQQVKEKYEITAKDIIREIAKRQIEKVMGI